MVYFETFGWVLTVHVRFAFLAIVAFWLPLLVRKGSRIHVVLGRIFVGCSLATLTTALVVAAWQFIDPIGTVPIAHQPHSERAAAFVRGVRMMSASLGAMALYTFIPLVLAVQVVRTRRHNGVPSGSGVRWLLGSQYAVGLILIVAATVQWILDPEATVCVVPLGVGFAGVGSAWWDNRSFSKLSIDSTAWWSKHLELMLRVGIAYHTVFVLFVLVQWLRGWGWASWVLIVLAVLPTAVGLPAIYLLIRHYRRQFADGFASVAGSSAVG